MLSQKPASNDLQKPESAIKHDNYEVGIKIVHDKDTRQTLGELKWCITW